MNIDALSSSISEWLINHSTQLIITIIIIAVYIFLDRFSTPKFVKGANESHFKDSSARKVIRIARIVTGIVGLLVIMLVWGIQFNSVLIFATTTITLLGVGFFASWSLLSNITAHLVLLLEPSFKYGVFIRVIDADNYTEGYLSELNLLNTVLLTENEEVIVYPNKLLIERLVVINPNDRFNKVGKLPSYSEKKIKDELSNE